MKQKDYHIQDMLNGCHDCVYCECKDLLYSREYYCGLEMVSALGKCSVWEFPIGETSNFHGK